MSKATRQRASSKVVCDDTIPNVRHADKLDNPIWSKPNQQTGTELFTQGSTSALFELGH
jgi:hypothetical protein